MKSTAKVAKSPAGALKKSKVFSDDELEAMQEAKRERRKGADGAADLRAKIEAMTGNDRVLVERIHEIVTAAAPELSPKTWYGMPAYAGSNGKVVCYFTPAGRFKSRYATFGFNDDAKLDDGNMWPTAFALTKLTESDARKIAALVRKAVG